jgi:cardiolipin synthase A/B
MRTWRPGRPALRLTALVFGWVAVLGGCARVAPHLALPHLALEDPASLQTFQAYTSAPIVPGNRVEILLNGQEIFPAILEAVRQARTTITYAQYSYGDGLVARELAEAFAERCRAGVGVSILLDSAGTLFMPREHVESMRRSGCHVVFFRPLSPWAPVRANNRNHRRILVIDGEIGFTGGSGVDRKWMGDGRVAGHWRETDVRVEGPVVEHLRGAFAENWLEATGIVLGGDAYFPRPVPWRGSVRAQVVRSSPAAGNFAMYTMFLLAIASASRSIDITNPYFVLDEAMTRALVDAARRGVRVRLLVPGTIDHHIVRLASRGQFGGLLVAGIEIYEYQAALLHAKTMVVDGVWATVGSTNLINRSFAMDDELNLVIYDAGVARRLEQVFAEDLAHAVVIDAASWRRRGVPARLLELLAAPLRHLGVL